MKPDEELTGIPALIERMCGRRPTSVTVDGKELVQAPAPSARTSLSLDELRVLAVVVDRALVAQHISSKHVFPTPEECSICMGSDVARAQALIGRVVGALRAESPADDRGNTAAAVAGTPDAREIGRSTVPSSPAVRATPDEVPASTKLVDGVSPNIGYGSHGNMQENAASPAPEAEGASTVASDPGKTAEPEMRSEYDFSHAHRGYHALLEAARHVVGWDWSENDEECVSDVDHLRGVVRAIDGAAYVESSEDEVKAERPTGEAKKSTDASRTHESRAVPGSSSVDASTTPHVHTNPSPSQEAGAWCNGVASDPGCGAFLPLRNFQKLTPKPEFVTEYLEPYLVDGRIYIDGRIYQPTAEDRRFMVDALKSKLAGASATEDVQP